MLAVMNSGLAIAEESKPIATQVGEAVRPAAEAYSRTVNRLFNEYMAGASKGPLGDAARANLKAQGEADRGVRRTMKECIKPGNVIDDDVKECMEGKRVKEW